MDIHTHRRRLHEQAPPPPLLVIAAGNDPRMGHEAGTARAAGVGRARQLLPERHRAVPAEVELVLGGERQQHHGVLRTRNSQNQFCNLAFGNSQNATCPNNQATLANDQQAFRSIGISAGSYVSSTLSFSTLVTEIAAGRPVMTRIGWTSGGGHMMDIIGYDSSDATIEYYNPGRTTRVTTTRPTTGTNSQFTWTHSLYRIGA